MISGESSAASDLYFLQDRCLDYRLQCLLSLMQKNFVPLRISVYPRRLEQMEEMKEFLHVSR